MPASVSQPPIPVPNDTNIVQVLTAIRNALIALTNTSAAQVPTASAFVVTQQVIVSVTYGAVVIPQLKSLTLLNSTTNEAWTWNAPAKMFTGGTVGAAL